MEFLDWICEADYFKQHRDSLARRTSGTGEWFLQHPEVQMWSKSTDSTLLCPGDPGVGKTILAASIIERLLKDVQSPMQPVMFIYFNYRRHGEQTTAHVVATLLRQILDAASRVPKYAQSFYEAHREKKTTPAFQEVKEMLKLVVGDLQGLSIITDALDECNDGICADVLSLVEELRKCTQVRYLATSRKFPSITSHPLFAHVPRLEIKASDEDLSVYIRSRFDGFKAKLQEDLRTKLVRSVIDAAGGMYVLIALDCAQYDKQRRLTNYILPGFSSHNYSWTLSSTN